MDYPSKFRVCKQMHFCDSRNTPLFFTGRSLFLRELVKITKSSKV
jgi:hypothetical protein